MSDFLEAENKKLNEKVRRLEEELNRLEYRYDSLRTLYNKTIREFNTPEIRMLIAIQADKERNERLKDGTM